MKQAVAIGVGASGDTIALDEAAEKQEIAMGVFLRAKDPGEDFAGGVIDGGEKHEPGPAIFEPGMVAAVQLDEEPGLGHALAAATMAGRAARARTADAGGTQQALHGLAGHPDALTVREEFGELVIIHTGVEGPRETQDAGADFLSEPAWGRPTAVAMGKGRRALLFEPSSEPPNVSWRQSQEPGGFPAAQDPVKDPGQNVHALVLPLGQGDRLPRHERTYSLTH